MRLSNSFAISASALTAQRLRMDVISSNIANADTTRANFVNGRYEPYRRKTVVMEEIKTPFASVLKDQMSESEVPNTGGIKVSKITEDASPFNYVYDPSNPDADAKGYVMTPNVDIAKEMVDMIAASRSYEANVTSMNASKAMFMKSLEIGR